MAPRKTKKKDQPPLYVIVEQVTRAGGGKCSALVPAFRYDDERLSSYRLGTKLVCTLENDGSRRGVRKWHAIIGTAMKGGNMPFATKEQADEGCRYLLDLFNIVPTTDRRGRKKFHRVPMSLNDLDDAELDQKNEELLGVIYRLTGIAPADFNRERAGAGDETFEPDNQSSAPADESPTQAGQEASPESAADASTLSPDASPPTSGEAPAADNASTPQAVSSGPSESEESSQSTMVSPTEEASASDSVASETGAVATAADAPQASAAATDAVERPTSERQAETPGPEDSRRDSRESAATNVVPIEEFTPSDLNWLKDGARLMLATKPAHEPEAHDVLFRQMKVILDLMPRNASYAAKMRMERMKLHCKAVCAGEEKLDLALMVRVSMATAEQIRPPDFKDSRPSSERAK